MRRVALLLAGALLAAALGAPVARAQNGAYRFEITRSGDSTLVFSVGGERWVRPGLAGIAVDARRRDALVATLRVMRVEGGTATALVTGQTTNLSVDHVVLLQRPPTPWYRQRSFWGALLFGLASGFAGARGVR